MPIAIVTRGVLFTLAVLWCAGAVGVATPLQEARQATDSQYAVVQRDVDAAFGKLQPTVIQPARGYIEHPYLVPGGYYDQMWDWDGFFIGCHLANAGQPQYLKWWVLNFAKAIDADGYVSGRITTKGPAPTFGKFEMKPFLAQGALIAAQRLGDFTWLRPVYGKLQRALEYRTKTQFDAKYGLYFWSSAGASGVDNSVVLSNEKSAEGSIISADINVWQVREFNAMAAIADRLGHAGDVAAYRKRAAALRANTLKYLWFPSDHSFWSIHRADGTPIRRVSFQNFVPLVEHILPVADGRAMIEKYLWNPEHMLSGYGLRSLSRQDRDYSNENMIVPYSNWRGPIWIVANDVYAMGLRNYGFDTEARQLAYMMGKLVLADIRANGTMHEDYDADTGAPLAPDLTQARQAGKTQVGFVGWDLLVQDMLRGARL